MTYYIIAFDNSDWSGIFDDKNKAFKALEILGSYELEDYTGNQEVWDILEDGRSVGYMSVIDMNSIITEF